MLLDTNESIYIWIGKLSTREDQRLSIQTAIEYLQTDPAGRDMNISIIHIKQEKEPPTFIGFFPNMGQEVLEVLQDIRKNKTRYRTEKCEYERHHDKSDHSDFDQYDKYPVNILKEPNDKLPAKINPLNKELHLTHDDFVSLFKMPYLQFEKLPRWKQQEMKKKVLGLH
ncbi:hypothetical protein NQ318_007434, partial [Aromia moschata]